MSRDHQAGNSAGTPIHPNQTDPNSPAERAAPAGESGSEGFQGASPSNTAPHNSNKPPVDGFKLLRVAVDSLYLSFPGDLHAPVQAALQALKVKAQSEHPEVMAEAQYPIGDHIFEVKDKGARVFPFVLEDNSYRIRLSRPGKKLPMAYVKVSAEYLAHKGPKAVHDELLSLLPEFGELAGTGSVSRIDLAVDFASTLVMDSWSREAWVTRATEIHSYAKDQVFTGWTIGMGGHISARLYNKIEEIFHTGKPWVMNQWIPAGWEPGELVWRLEFELKRDFLQERSLKSLDSVLDNLNGLWSYAATEWLRLTVPSATDATRTRWPTHPLWMALASVDWESASSVLLDKCSNSRTPSELRLITVVLGSLVSYMAMHKLDDRLEAMDRILSDLYSHYSAKVASKGLTFDEFLARRVAAKAREFNTSVNAPGLVDNLKQDFTDSQADAYRKASDGE